MILSIADALTSTVLTLSKADAGHLKNIFTGVLRPDVSKNKLFASMDVTVDGISMTVAL